MRAAHAVSKGKEAKSKPTNTENKQAKHTTKRRRKKTNKKLSHTTEQEANRLAHWTKKCKML